MPASWIVLREQVKITARSMEQSLPGTRPLKAVKCKSDIEVKSGKKWNGATGRSDIEGKVAQGSDKGGRS
ncbi:MAG: hypothetical protein DMF06_09635 [Verrucomicrobia bacterium]|nr:MAG: hypothetical protein DMF06_09635 [Verrucomicrobiota bacterium]